MQSKTTRAHLYPLRAWEQSWANASVGVDVWTSEPLSTAKRNAKGMVPSQEIADCVIPFLWNLQTKELQSMDTRGY